LVAEVERFVPDIDAAISARSIALMVKSTWPEFSAEHAAIWQLNRSFGYQLNYYAEREIPEWKPENPRPNWLLVGKGKQQEAAKIGFRCVEFKVLPAVIPCRDTGSLGGLGGGNAGDDRAGRQPR
jgi:hypothetical protein